jgi:hypothetical protein
MKLLRFGGIFVHFDLAGLHQLPRAVIPLSPVESHSWGGFLVYEMAIPSRITNLLADSSSMRYGSNSQENHHLVIQFFPKAATAAVTRGRVLAVRGQKILRLETIPGSLTLKDPYRQRIFFFKIYN